MDSTEKLKAWIDSASYLELLRQWRFAPTGSPYFAGEVGEHFQKALVKKRTEVGDAAHVAASKALGWRH